MIPIHTDLYIPMPELSGKNVITKEDTETHIGVLKKGSVWKIRKAQKYDTTNYGGSTYLVGVANGTIFVTLESLDASMPFMPVVIYGDNFQAENR